MYIYPKKQVGGACRDIPGKEPLFPGPGVMTYGHMSRPLFIAAARRHRLDFSDLR